MRNNFQESLQIQHVACEICNCCTIERLLFHNQYFLYFLHSNISRHCDQKISRPLKNYPHQMIFLLRAIPILHISQNNLLMHVSLNIQVAKFRIIHNLTLDRIAYQNHTYVTFALSTYLLYVRISQNQSIKAVINVSEQPLRKDDNKIQVENLSKSLSDAFVANSVYFEISTINFSPTWKF